MSKVIKFSPVYKSDKAEAVEIKRLNAFANKIREEEHDPGPSHRLNAQQEAENILRDARLQAERILSDAERTVTEMYDQLKEKEASVDESIEKAHQKAAHKGFEEGYKHGMQQSEAEYTGKLQEARRILESAQEHYHQKLLEVEPDLIKLSTAVAGKILGETLQSEEKWSAFVSHTLTEVKREEDIRLFVSPMHYHATVNLTNELSKVTNTDIVVYPDESKGENGCIIETKYGQIDASLDSQLDELKEKLLEFVGDQHDRNHRDS